MYKNLHLINNDKFFEPAYKAFEKYYHKDNFYYCLTSVKDQKIYSQNDNILYISLGTFKGLKLAIKTFQKHKFINVFIHNTDFYKIDFVFHVRKQSQFKLFWIFFGADLHGKLEESGKLNALDSIKVNPTKLNILSMLKEFYQGIVRLFIFNKWHHYSFSSFCEEVDYFCFWNEYDYQLLIDNFKTKASFKNFIYLELLPHPSSFNKDLDKNKILVNHNASPYGNHQTILSKLKTLQVAEEIICPISYGDVENAEAIKKLGSSLFSGQISFIEGFLNKDEYFDLISSTKVAIFGHRRQEAGANIFAMILNGSKVFLRNDNSVLTWLRKRGFICFSFEDDLNSVDDFLPLDQESISKNRALYMKYFSTSSEKDMFDELFN